MSFIINKTNFVSKRHEYVQSREGITSMKMLLTWMEKGQMCNTDDVGDKIYIQILNLLPLSSHTTTIRDGWT